MDSLHTASVEELQSLGTKEAIAEIVRRLRAKYAEIDALKYEWCTTVNQCFTSGHVSNCTTST